MQSTKSIRSSRGDEAGDFRFELPQPHVGCAIHARLTGGGRKMAYHDSTGLGSIFSVMRRWRLFSGPFSRTRAVGFFLLALAVPVAVIHEARGSSPLRHLVPAYQYTQTLVASEDMEVRKYLCFPIAIRLGESDVLIAHKRGFSHAFDAESSFDLVRYDPLTERSKPQGSLYRPNSNFENAEFVRFANGDISCYIDNQQPTREPGSSEATRLGLIEFRSTDGGRTFKDRDKLGLVDGVEYGYVFSSVTEGSTTWILAMTFANLPGGKAILPTRPQAGAVAVLRTDDHGKKWRFVKNLTEAFGCPINESSFIRHQGGFLFTCRPYVNSHLLVVTDHDFNPIRQLDLVAHHDFIAQGMGRPRVFEKDGRYYLLGRNTSKPTATAKLTGGPDMTVGEKLNRMMLSLLRFDPSTLAVESHVILDNAQNQRVVDAYYAVPFWQKRKGKEYFNVITYKSVFGRMPDIVRFEYEWDEVK